MLRVAPIHAWATEIDESRRCYRRPGAARIVEPLSTRSSRLPFQNCILVVLAACAAGYAVFIARASSVVNGHRTFTLFDDAMISMRYARNLAGGHGLTWNSGQTPVEGYTNFAWTLWMSLVHLAGVPERYTSLAISISGGVLLLVTAWLVAKLVHLLAPELRWAPLMGTVFTATSYPLLYWSLRGMEVSVVAFVVTATAYRMAKWSQAEERNDRTLIKIGMLLGLGFLIRPDVGILAVVTIPSALFMATPGRRVRALLFTACPFLIAVIGISIFRESYYHSLVPNTYTLKVSKVPLSNRLHRGLRAIATQLLRTGLGVATVLSIAGLTVRRPRSIALWYCAALVTIFAAYSVYVGGDAWEIFGFADRYVSSVLPVGFALCAIGVATLAEGRRLPMRITGLIVAAIVVVFAGAFIHLPHIDAQDIQPLAAGKIYILGAVVLLVGIVVLGLKRRAALPGLLLMIGLCLALSGRGYERWVHEGAEDSSSDAKEAAYGYALEKDTKPGATIAISSAGNIAYFAPKRTFIDELGKMDPTIAKLAPDYPQFPPGHQKKNYNHSIRDLRPDLIGETYGRTDQDLANFKTWGYRQISFDAFVRTDSNKIDVEALQRDYLNNNVP
jgi:arabinofuranosyltransferase